LIIAFSGNTSPVEPLAAVFQLLMGECNRNTDCCERFYRACISGKGNNQPVPETTR